MSAPARTAYCQGWVSARASDTAEPRMAPIAAGPAPSRNAADPVIAADPVEAPAAEQDEHEGRREGDQRGEESAAEPRRRVADDSDGLHDRAGGDLAEGDRVEELRAGHPVVVTDRVGLHERDDHEPAAVGQGADLERHPGHRQQDPAADRARGPRPAPPGCSLALRAAAGGELGAELDEAAAEQDEHQPGPMVAAAAAPAAR